MKKQGSLESEFVNDCHLGSQCVRKALWRVRIAVSQVFLLRWLAVDKAVAWVVVLAVAVVVAMAVAAAMTVAVVLVVALAVAMAVAIAVVVAMPVAVAVAPGV